MSSDTSKSSDSKKQKRSLKNIFVFFSEVKLEMSRVVWPTRRETLMTTVFVFVLAVIAAIYFSFVDQCIYRLLHMIIG